MTRIYVPSTLPDLAQSWRSGQVVERAERVVAADEAEDSEYAALLDAADASGELLAGLPDGQRRRVVVVAEPTTGGDEISWRDVVSLHVDDADDTDPDEDLGWWATQEIEDLVADL